MTSKPIVREATHAGSWYADDASQLEKQLNTWLDHISSPVNCIGPRSQSHTEPALPVPGARIIIAPHAGYAYSGPAAAWAYRTWDISAAKRVFLLGPSHHHSLSKAALTKCTIYRTPIGDLEVDPRTTEQLFRSGLFEYMSQAVDEREHSLELHLPYICTMFKRTFGQDRRQHPQLIPIMVGNTSSDTEIALGRILSEYIADPTSAFVISSDFAHWGTRFGYTYYSTPRGRATDLNAQSRTPVDWPIHESIKAVDFECIDACESGSHAQWLDCLHANGNTVCGRHPIGVAMSAMERVREHAGSTNAGTFRFVRYERSSEVRRASESSVSYASAFAVV